MKAAIVMLLLIAAIGAFVAISGIQRIASSGGATTIGYYDTTSRIVAGVVGAAALFAAYGCFRKHPLFVRHTKNKTFQPLDITRRSDLRDQPLASFRRRSIAFGLDFTFVLFLVAIASLREVQVEGAEGQNFNLHLDPFHGWALLSLPVYFGLGTYLGKGRTLGKKFMRIRVLSLAHEHLSLWHSIERSLGYGASMLEGGFGFFQYFIHQNCQTVHDRIAETIVVFEPVAKRPRDQASKPMVEVVTSPAGSELCLPEDRGSSV